MMSFLKQIFGRVDRNAAAASRMFTYPPDQAGGRGASAEHAARRELLRAVLRKTLNRHGIPTTWLSAEMLVATSRGRQTGIHWRLLIKHWDPRLLPHAVALQNSLILRLLNHDPLAAEWLMGISWQFALAEEDTCPPMPYPGFWTAEPALEPEEEALLEVPGGSADVISGPPHVPTGVMAHTQASDSIRSDLDKLLAVRDAELQGAEERFRSAGSEATQPMYLKTEPQPLAELNRR
jgi:hypothetical protein